MTTPDSKYKHKPSEKHTLEEVLKSLQDMIRNDLLDDKQANVPVENYQTTGSSYRKTERREQTEPIREDFAPTTPGSGPVNLDAVMRSLKDLINHELDTGENTTSDENASQEMAEEDKADLSQSEEFVPLDEELTFEDSEIREVDEEPAPSDVSLAPAIDQGIEDPAPEEFEPLDEELTIEGLAGFTASPASDTVPPDLPGEISPDLLEEPENEPPPVSLPQSEEEIASGNQQEFKLDDLPPRVIEHEALEPDDVHEPEPAPGNETGSSSDRGEIDEPLPTIDVEETFDENNYFHDETPQAETLPSELQEIQEIIVSALGNPPEVDEQKKKGDDLLPDTESDPSTDKITISPDESGLTLEVVDEQNTAGEENPVVGFDSISLEEPAEERKSTPSTPDDKTAAETTTHPAAPDDTVDDTQEKASHESDEVGEPKARDEILPDNPATASDTRKSRKSRKTAASKSKTDEPSSSSSLDDIPVLKDVVAPPTGSTLKAETASKSSKDRLPRPDRAREIVVRAVAKLNVEMRKSGGTGIDTKTILRLQKLIQEQLEKDGDE